jgi:hypothetical protein
MLIFCLRATLPSIFLAFIKENLEMYKSKLDQASSVSIATRYGMDGPDIESRWGARFSTPVKTGHEAHQAFYTMDTGSFPR